MIHPETGEVLETREQFQAAIMRVEQRLTAIYRLRNQLHDGRLEIVEPAVLPERRSRTPTQDRVARCPRCGMKLESEEASA